MNDTNQEHHYTENVQDHLKQVESLVLNEPIEIVMNNGQPTGDWRFPGGSWTKARKTQGISIPWVKAELTPLAGPEIRTSLVVKTRHQPTN